MEPIRDQFTTTQLGNLFMMRLIAFIRDHNARLIDIDEHSARLQIGGRSFSDWLFGREYVEKTIIELQYETAPNESKADPTERLTVDLAVRPSRLATGRDFDSLASHVIREFRGYFAAV